MSEYVRKQNTSTVSFSIDYASLGKVHQFMEDQNFSRSQAIRLLVKYGLIYHEQLKYTLKDIQGNEENGEEVSNNEGD